MAEEIPLSKIPLHVAAQLVRLTERPGVQSTLVLSKKDGSIIQTTGLIAASSEKATPSSTSDHENDASETTKNPISVETHAQTVAYKPSPAEKLAVHIHAFVASASLLSRAVSSSTEDDERFELDGKNENYAGKDQVATGAGSFEDPVSPDRDGDDKLELLRLRTQVHEIFIIPHRKWLFCAVYDATLTATNRTGKSAAHPKQ